ncbi:MAG TPA: HEAT repeat domain-containing protein [Streptosporangiaceae bacterium]|nr:HEAT repeat domain-containing protein [Streptosporangiaceae bacterium]
MPAGVDVMRLTSPIRVREGVGSEPGRHESAADAQPYALPSDQAADERHVADWQVVTERENRVVILAHPGMGKSWLIRWETVRVARAALDLLAAGGDVSDVLLPIPVRCDELAAAAEATLADAACDYLIERYAVPQRSRAQLRELIAGGNVVLLLDALDELADRQAQRRLHEMLGRWAAGPQARFRLTSRVAGFTNSPLPPSTFSVVELLPFTPADVSSVIAAWGLRDDLAERLSGQISGPAMASVARIPLLTALLCATAGGGGELPVHAAGIYERVLRRFLAQENRWPQLPEPEPTDIDRPIELLAPLAFHFAVRPDGWADRMPASQVMAVLRSLGPVFTELGRDAAAILRDLSVRAGVLVPSATQNAGHASHLVRHAAVRALQPRSGDPDVAAALLQRFSDPSPQVQEAAIRAMQAADRSPEVTPALTARLSDDYDVVRRAAASVLQIASTPAPLLHLAALTALPAEPGLRALYGAAEMLAENVYRLLAREDRPAVLASLARLTDLAVQPEEPPEPSDTADPRPDSGFLETEVVISVQGHNKQGDSVYSYIQLTGRSLRRLFAAMEAGVNFVPSDYGEVLAAGKGTPPPEVVKEMTEKYNMMETPLPEAAEDEGPATGNPGFGRYISPFLVDPGSDGME